MSRVLQILDITPMEGEMDGLDFFIQNVEVDRSRKWGKSAITSASSPSSAQQLILHR